MLKKFWIYTRKGIRFIILFAISIFLIIGAVAFLYKPTYSVSMNGEQVGYTENKSQLQNRINEYKEKGDGTNKNIAFVQLKNNPEYELCLLKKNITPNDEEIFNKAKEGEVPYYRYYALCENEQEKVYVSEYQDAEKAVNDLKGKKSKNCDQVKITEKYEPDMKELNTSEEAVSKLFVEPENPVRVASSRSKSSSNRYSAKGSVNTSRSIGSGKANVGISFINPVSGLLTSGFGNRHGRFHTGLDIATSTGTPIRAAASGTVTFAGWKGSYGNLIVVSHGNGVQTYYAHCSRLCASVGAKVSQGQQIATVGSTGNSTGPHLHLEVRVNGKAYNPRNYMY